ncbi:DUF2752 domain-containing protein [Iamia sp. SCSIO 61187]|uniref:DUF2752 domain-containing protein n=1 Tax=Iamia sp. SCSIO 61187 TaxID=2722752 RepID=UPI001C62CF5C|nr:DUF2752 domain-containing protein [Iamia sp. SCSIO 61187]QYG94248.1 DUF2752 domain-containing protein [Iamia sp. SCSIO 61187]
MNDPDTRRRIIGFTAEDRMPWLTALLSIGILGGLYLRIFGLPGRDLHGFLHRAGVMDPFCGGTRATYLLVRGRLVEAWSWNPLVPLLALGAVVIFVRIVLGLTTNRWLQVSLSRRAWVPGVSALLVIIEINQQLQAERLMEVVPT